VLFQQKQVSLNQKQAKQILPGGRQSESRYAVIQIWTALLGSVEPIPLRALICQNMHQYSGHQVRHLIVSIVDLKPGLSNPKKHQPRIGSIHDLMASFLRISTLMEFLSI
jgi:hypothetical protein